MAASGKNYAQLLASPGAIPPPVVDTDGLLIFRAGKGYGLTTLDAATYFQSKLTLAGLLASGAIASGADAQRQLSGVYILAHSAVQQTLTGTLSETSLASITVPGNLMGNNGILRITTLWGFTNNANVKTVRVRFGGVGGTIYQSLPGTSALNMRMQCEIHNRNVTNSQVGAPNGLGGGGWNTTAGGLSTGALDTTAAQTIELRGLLTNVADTITLESYLIEVMNGQGT